MTILIVLSVFVFAMLGTLWLIARLFRIKPPKPAAGKPAANPPAGTSNTQQPAGKPATPPPSGLAALASKKWWKPVAIIGSVILLYVLWDSISAGLASLLAQSDAGETIGIKEEPVQRWLWVPGVIIGFLLLKKLFKSKDSPPAWGQRTLAESITAFSDGALMWTVALIIVVPIIGITAVVVDIAGVPETVANFSRDSARVAACTTQKEAWNIRIDTAGRHMVICPEEKSLYVFPEKGYDKLVFDFSAEFKEKHKDLLRGRKLEDFVLISAPHEYRGHAAGVWRIMPLQSRPELKFVSAWDRSGMDDIAIVAYATN